MHLILIFNSLYPYLTNFHYFADNNVFKMLKERSGDERRAENRVTLMILFFSHSFEKSKILYGDGCSKRVKLHSHHSRVDKASILVQESVVVLVISKYEPHIPILPHFTLSIPKETT
jgi:hypothetical protein